MTKEVYKFKLRKDMPPGFIRNKDSPEIPAAYRFLKNYHNKKFQSLEEFEKVLDKFKKYLEKHRIKEGKDKERSQEIRRGLFFYNAYTGNISIHTVYCNAIDGRGSHHECHFGTLEKKLN